MQSQIGGQPRWAHASASAVGLLACALWTVGCGKDKPEAARFTLALVQQKLTIPEGSQGAVEVEVTREEGFDGEVQITFDGASDGFQGDEANVSGPWHSAVLRVRAGLAERGEYTFDIIGTSGKKQVREQLRVEVVETQPSSQDLIAAALEAGEIDYPTSLLYRAYAMFTPAELPRSYQGDPGRVAEDMGLFHEASREDLPEDVREKLEPYLLRPADPLSVFNAKSESTNKGPAATAADATCGEAPNGAEVRDGWKTVKAEVPVRVWVQCTGNAEQDDDLLEYVRVKVQRMFPQITGDMREPVYDDGKPGSPANIDSAIDIYVVAVGKSVRRTKLPVLGGIAPGAPPFADKRASGYVLIARELGTSPRFYSLLVHEFFHVIESAYDNDIMFETNVAGRPETEFWLVEAAADWAASHFARSSAATEVYPQFVKRFQQSKQSLHRSYPTVITSAPGVTRAEADNMYAGFIWPFFMEQEQGAWTMNAAWSVLRGATNHERANELLAQIYDFKTNFKKFALRNLNFNAPGVLDEGQRYKATDRKEPCAGCGTSTFPDGEPPDYDHQSELKIGRTVSEVEIAPLRAGYFQYVLTADKARRVTVDFTDLKSDKDADVMLLKRDGKQWTLAETTTAERRHTFCFDKGRFDELIVILVNHQLPLTQFILGSLSVDASEDVCSSEQWTGVATATDVYGWELRAEITWAKDEKQNFEKQHGVTYHVESGKFSMQVGKADCEIKIFNSDFTLSAEAAADHDDLGSHLYVDYSVDPPTYEGAFEVRWKSRVTRKCDPALDADGDATEKVGGRFFATGYFDLVTVPPSFPLKDGGRTMSDSYEDAKNEITYQWRFTLQ